MRTPEEKSRNIGIVTSVGFHVALLLLFFFTVAMTVPNPPITDFGGSTMMLGFDDQGSGEELPELSENAGNDETKPEEETPQQVEETTAAPAEPQKTDDNEGQLTSEEESPVVAKEGKKEEKKEPVKEKVEEKVNPVVEYKKEEKKESKGDATSDGGKTSASQGNDTDKTGDKGRPEGKIDGNALYGNGGSGGGNGMALSMSGWAWADPPKIPSLPDNADGRIVFEIECDEDGEIVGITTVERGLSPRAEQLLKEEIRRNSLIRTSAGKVPERSKGRVVFILKTQ